MQQYVENYIEILLKKYFQKTVTFYLDDLEYKSGKFVLFKFMLNSNNFYIEFHIQNKKLECVKIPYPFAIEEYEEDDLLYFDFRVKTLCKDNMQLVSSIDTFANTQEDIALNKFYNKILEIKFT